MDSKQVFANMVNWYNANSKPTYHSNNIVCKVSHSVTSLLSKLHKGFNIVDSGADTHVVGNTWKPLDIIDYHTPRANVIGFATNIACKKELPIGAYVTKTTTTAGKEIILRALHAVGNVSSSHTLLCTYQMREIGLIVDDVSKHHVANKSGIKGTQSIVFQDGTTVALKCKHTLMSFTTTIPTEYEIASLPTYDIAMKEWDPQMYYDGINDDLSIMSNISVPEHDSGEDTIDVVHHSADSIVTTSTPSEYNSPCSQENLDVNDHLDTEDSKQKPTKDIDKINPIHIEHVCEPQTGEVVSRSLISHANPKRGAIVTQTELEPIITINSNSGGVFWMINPHGSMMTYRILAL